MDKNAHHKSALIKKKIKKISGKRCILVFVRAPEKGKVKTRLANVIGNDAAFRLYMSFVEDELDMLRTLFFDVIICFHPHTERESVENWLNHDFDLMAQHGDNLGQRMDNAFEEVFSRGYQQALLIGSDLPNLPSSIILDAFDHLIHYDSVIGPCEDGGYYLIGFCANTYYREIFMHIDWGSVRVCEQTLSWFHKKSLNYQTLTKWRDIDDHEDLLWLKKSLDKDPNTAKHTHNCLMTLDNFDFF
jgi:uncharacterized protein